MGAIKGHYSGLSIDLGMHWRTQGRTWSTLMPKPITSNGLPVNTNLHHVLLFLGLPFRDAKVEKEESREGVLFIDNTVQTPIPFKERHRDVLKVHAQLGERVSV